MCKVGKAILAVTLLGGVLGTGATLPSAHATSVERPAAINGTGEAAVFAAYDGSGGSPLTSYIRFFDGGSSTTTFSITIVGSQSGNTYGQPFTLQIPAFASPQYSLGQLLALAGTAAGAGAAGGDASFALFIIDPDATAGYQHVTFNSVSTLFENNSVCNNGLLAAAYLSSTGQNVLTNVHTSTLSGYPSVVYFYNYSTTPVSAPVTIYDAGTVGSDGKTPTATAGKLIGSTTIQVPANGLVTEPFSALQTLVNWTPTSSQLHANVVVGSASSTNPVILVHSITNATLGGSINMTSACAVNAPSSSSSSGSSGGSPSGSTATTTYEGTLAGNDGTSGTLSVTVDATISSNTAPIKSARAAGDGIEKPQDVVAASGTILLSYGSTVTLTGTFDSSTSTVTLSGGGYSFAGTATSSGFSGRFTGPNNSTGGFSAISGSASSVTAFCGTENNGGGFNLQVSSSGVLSGETSDGATLTGQVTGSTFSGSSSDGHTFTGSIQNGQTSVTVSGGSTASGNTCSLPSSNQVQRQTVTVKALGKGSVTSSPSGINCTGIVGGNTCASTFNVGTTVTLSAIPASNQTFQGWSGSCSGTGACSVVPSPTSAPLVTAQFTNNSPTQTVTVQVVGSGTVISGPAGISCTLGSGTCATAFNVGDPVSLFATPAVGQTFQGWGGACSGTGSCSVIPTDAFPPLVTATFTNNSLVQKVTVQIVGLGNVTSGPPGIYCAGSGGTCSANFAIGTAVTLVASSPLGQDFQGWNGDCGGGGSCVVVPTSTFSPNVTATFISDQDLKGGGSGGSSGSGTGGTPCTTSSCTNNGSSPDG
jgi:hypothetical protein